MLAARLNVLWESILLLLCCCCCCLPLDDDVKLFVRRSDLDFRFFKLKDSAVRVVVDQLHHEH